MTVEPKTEELANQLTHIMRMRGFRKAHTTLMYPEGKASVGWFVSVRQERAGFRTLEYGMAVETEEEFNKLKAAMTLAVSRLP